MVKDWKKIARKISKRRAKQARLVDAIFEGMLDCRGQDGRCGRLTNNAWCWDCMNGQHPLKLAEDEIKRLRAELEALKK